jgi:pimeloyl-ACP methyl ester carboxylesterase
VPKINFQETGRGPVILLLHGFPMNQAVWDEFRFLLSGEFRVISIDLPGFGGSDLPNGSFSLDDAADTILAWLLQNNIHTCVPIGHSLGGYIALAMVEKDAKQFAGFGLFHSTAYADSAEKKESRLKVIDFVKRNGALAFTSNFIPPLFADPHHPAIETVRSIATQSSAEAVEIYTHAMRNRPDRLHTIKQFVKPILFIGGEQDSGISTETILEQGAASQTSEIHILPNVAHMGMFENPETCAYIIKNFSKNCFQKVFV